jgi:hypothetical protein
MNNQTLEYLANKFGKIVYANRKASKNKESESVGVFLSTVASPSSPSH